VLVFGVIFFGLTSLALAWVSPLEGVAGPVTELGYGILVGIILTVGVASQLLAAELKIAGVQQAALAVPALLIGSALAADSQRGEGVEPFDDVVGAGRDECGGRSIPGGVADRPDARRPGLDDVVLGVPDVDHMRRLIRADRPECCPLRFSVADHEVEDARQAQARHISLDHLDGRGAHYPYATAHRADTFDHLEGAPGQSGVAGAHFVVPETNGAIELGSRDAEVPEQGAQRQTPAIEEVGTP
jgi:hypothetical protein